MLDKQQIEELAAEWLWAKKKETEAKEYRLKIEAELLDGAPLPEGASPEDGIVEGSITEPAITVDVQYIYKTSRSVIPSVLEEVVSRGALKEAELERCVVWKPTLNLREYRKLKDRDFASFLALSKAIETKQAKTGIKVLAKA